MAAISNPAINPPAAPWRSSLGEFMSRAQAMITPETTPTKRKMIHVSKARPRESFSSWRLPPNFFHDRLWLSLVSVRGGFKIRATQRDGHTSR